MIRSNSTAHQDSRSASGHDSPGCRMQEMMSFLIVRQAVSFRIRSAECPPSIFRGPSVRRCAWCFLAEASVFGLRDCEEHWSENPWIPAFAGMTSTAFLPSFPRRRESIRPIRTRMPAEVDARCQVRCRWERRR